MLVKQHAFKSLRSSNEKNQLMILASTFSLAAAQASTGVTYKVGCLVYGQTGIQYVARLEEGVMPNNEIFRQMNLVIVKDGKVIARAMAEFDPARESYAIVSAEGSVSSLSCVQNQ